MKTLLDRLAFIFSLSGVVCRGRRPIPTEVEGWARLGKPLLPYTCKVCGIDFWSWKKTSHCGQFKCFQEVRHAHK